MKVKANSNKYRISVKITIIFMCAIIMAIIGLSLSFSNAFAEEETEKATNSPTMTATLYDTDSYSAGTGTTLTEEGVTIEGWQYDTSKYLQIDTNVPDDGNTYEVVVELPQEMYIVGTELATQSGFQTPEFTKNEDIVINQNYSYPVQKYSGTAKYKMKEKGTSGTIQLEVRYDKTLWDKRNGSPITKEGVCPIKVTFNKIDSNDVSIKASEYLVNKITAKGTISYRQYITIKKNSETDYSWTGITLKKEETVDMSFYALESTQQQVELYYNEYSVSIQCPSYTDKEKNIYYLEPDLESLEISNFKQESREIDVSKLNDGLLVIKFKNVLLSTGSSRFKLKFKGISNELLDMEDETITFNSGRIFVNVVGKSGNSYNVSNNLIPVIAYQIKSKENVKVSGRRETVSINNRPNEIVSQLGGFSISNSGTSDSVEKEIYCQFDMNNTSDIKVTTINLFADTLQQYVEVEYSLVSDKGEPVYFDDKGNIVDSSVDGATNVYKCKVSNPNYNKNLTNDIYIRLIRSNLDMKHRQYFFKSVKYKVMTIKAGSNNGGRANEYPGNFFGYISENATVSNYVKNSIIVTSPEQSGIIQINASSYWTFSDANTVGYEMGAKFNKNVIEAGENFSVSGYVGITGYPYGNATWLKGIRIGIILPNGVDINENSIYAKSNTGVQINSFEVTNRYIENNNKLWIIKFSNDFYIGMSNESINRINNGSVLNFSFQLNTSNTLNNTTLYAKDIVFSAGYKQKNDSGGAYEWSRQIDTYDLNENGSTTDYIGRMRSTNTTSIQITAKSTELNISDNITRTSNNSITQENKSIPILTKDDKITYNLDINCNNGGRAEEFVGYIPIPKKTSSVDNFIIDGDISNYFNFNLQSSPTITGSNIYTIKYAFQTGLNYESAKTYENWYTKDEIEADESLKWENVTMLKITANEGIIENGSKTRISLSLKYSGNNYGQEAGFINKWHSAFYYKYVNGSITSSGNYATEGVSTNLTYNMNLPDVTLTAAKNMTPNGEGNINNYTTFESDIPTFKNTQNFSITEVETYNVTLKEKNYIIQNTNMPGIEANETFAITAKMNNGDEKSILESQNTALVQLGMLDKEDILKFTYKIYNANSISDNTVSRYIVVTFKSDNGVTIKQKININREIAQATNPKSAIVGGKSYIAFDDVTSKINITQNASFTAQFVINYIPSIYNKQLIQFSNNMPIGTSVVFMNITDQTNPQYWYYKFNESANSIVLTDLISMGTTNTKNYEYKTTQDPIEERFLAIVDFSDCKQDLEIGTYSVKMVFTGDNVEDFNSKNLEFNVAQKRTFEITSDKDSVNINEELTIKYVTTVPNVVASIANEEDSTSKNDKSDTLVDSKYVGRKTALVLKASENIPLDTHITQNGTTYYLNTNRQFIIPLKEVQNEEGTISIKLLSNMLSKQKKEYSFNAELWVSSTANAITPLMGEKVAEKQIQFNTIEQPNPSLKITNMANRKITKNELSNQNTITFNCEGITTDLTATVELQKKEGTGYQIVTDKLSQVNGITEHNKGAFSIDIANGENTAIFKLATSTEVGTYRIVIKVYDSNNNVLLEVPYGLLVIEN